MARITFQDLNALRMPPDALGNPGLQDLEALKAASWGTDYDVDARRRRIAEALTAQQLAQAAPRRDSLAGALAGEDLNQIRLSGTEPGYGITGGASPGAGAGASQPGDASSVSIGGLFGGSTPGFHEGAPPGGSMFGDRAAVDPVGGAMTTSNAAMITDTTNTDRTPGAFDPATGAPIGYDPVTGTFDFESGGGKGRDFDTGGREGFAGGPGAPGARGGTSISDIADIADVAPTGGAVTTHGKGDRSTDEGNLPEGATSTVGDRTALGLPQGSGLPSMVGLPSLGQVVDAFGNVVAGGKSALGRGWDAVTAPVLTPSDVPVGVPVATAPPTGRAPMSFAPVAPTAPGIPSLGIPGAAPGGGGFSGFGGFSESSPGGYAGGPGMTTGFGAGYSGSSDFGNTQGAQGFTTGGFSSGSAQGFSTGSAVGSGGFGPGGDTSGGSGDTSGGGGGGGSGSDGSSGGDNTGGSSGVG